jgi:hypothetical protein
MGDGGCGQGDGATAGRRRAAAGPAAELQRAAGGGGALPSALSTPAALLSPAYLAGARRSTLGVQQAPCNRLQARTHAQFTMEHLMLCCCTAACVLSG